MNNMKRKITLVSGFFVALWTAQTALAWYDPSTGRWLSRDPLGDEAGAPYMIIGIQPRIEPRSPHDFAAMSRVVRDPLTQFSQVNVNLYGSLGNNPLSNIDPFGLDFADCYAACLVKYRSPIDRSLGEICNAIGNKIAGPVPGKFPSKQGPGHPTTWQHKVGSKLGNIGSKIGKVAGHAAIIATIADGFFDIGLLDGCAIACGEDYPGTHQYNSVTEQYGAF